MNQQVKKNFNVSFYSLIKDTNFNTNMISLNNSFELLALFKTFGFRILNAIGIKRKGGYATRLNFMLKFFRYLLFLKKQHGSEFVVQFLKTGQLAIQRKLAGNPVSSLRELNPLLNLPRLVNGLPSIIPAADRYLIRKGQISIIRYWLTLFSIYRIISIPGELNFSTIITPFGGCDKSLASFTELLNGVSKQWVSLVVKIPSFKESEVFMINQASPTSSRSWHGFFYDLHIMPKHTYCALIEFLKVTQQNRLLTYIEGFKELGPVLEAFGKFLANLKPFAIRCFKERGEYPCGQLSTKLEAAGKIRVFAMVDYWSQISLKGLHDYIFDILRALPNDGTFDQGASIRRAAEKVKLSGCSFGYDLSAATDRLPLELQIGVLSSFFSWQMAYAWADLLVYKRDYLESHNRASPGMGTDFTECESFKYAVGQPMGALSSWGMLALTHHLIVQIASKLADPLKKVCWFEGYELLGDDIVIFDKKVAMQYLELMRLFGVPINLSKSVIANNATVEFAKVTTHNGVDCSALSWKLFLSTSRSLMGRVSITYFLLKKGIGLDHFRTYIQGLLRQSKYTEGSYSPGFVALMTILSNQGVFTLSWLIGYLNNVKNPLQSWYSSILLSLDVGRCFAALNQYFVMGVREFTLNPMRDKLRKEKEVWIVMLLLKKLAMMKHKLHPDSFLPLRCAEETLKEILPNYHLIPGEPGSWVTAGLKKDLFDFFTACMVNRTVQQKLNEWHDIDIRRLDSLEEYIHAIMLYQSIVAHFSAHLGPKKAKVFKEESPLKVLTYISDLSKSVPDFVKRKSVNSWFS